MWCAVRSNELELISHFKCDVATYDNCVLFFALFISSKFMCISCNTYISRTIHQDCRNCMDVIFTSTCPLNENSLQNTNNPNRHLNTLNQQKKSCVHLPKDDKFLCETFEGNGVTGGHLLNTNTRPKEYQGVYQWFCPYYLIRWCNSRLTSYKWAILDDLVT